MQPQWHGGGRDRRCCLTRPNANLRHACGTTMLNGVSVARRTLPKPPAVITSRSRASPALRARRADAHLLRQPNGHADRRSTQVGTPRPTGLRFSSRAVVGHRLDHHPGAIGLQEPDARTRPRHKDRPCPAGSRRTGHEVEAASPENSFAVATSEERTSADRAMLLGVIAVALLDRARMEIVTDELRLGVRLRHQHGRPAVTAADIGHRARHPRAWR